MSLIPETISLSQPWIGAPEVKRVTEALKGRLAGDGPIGRAVEARLARLLAVPRVLLTTSCTHALELALLALGVGPGDEVICPSFTFVSTANAILRVGARPVFADIEETTLGLDPDDVQRRLGSATSVLLPIHYGGIAARLPELLQLASDHGLKIVEDAAHALGASLHGRPLGTWGDAGCFSFHETKNVTCGEGGALVLRDPERARQAEIIREKGTNRAAFLRGDVEKYTWVAEGSSYVLSDILAAVLDAQLDRFREIQERRAQCVERYRVGLGDWANAQGVRLPPQRADRVSSHHNFYLLFPSPSQRDLCLAHLRGQAIQASFHYVPLHSSPMGRSLAPFSDLPVTDRVAGTLLRLPLHPLLSAADLDRVVSAVRSTPS